MIQDKKIVVNGYTYKIGNYKVRKGSIVILPTPKFLRDVKGESWEGIVQATESDYTGNCIQIRGVKKY